MRPWIAAAFLGVVLAAYALFYLISSDESHGVSSFGVVNMVGLVAVVVGIVAAGAILRRASPPR